MGISEMAEQGIGLLPRWSDSRSPQVPPAETTLGTEETVPATEATGDARYAPPAPRPDTSDTRTRTSASTGKPDRAALKLTGELVVALLGGLAVMAAVAVRWRTGSRRKLREPTTRQLEEVGEPIGRILARHLDPELLNPDLADAIMAGAGVGRYLNDGPVLLWDRPDPNLPPDLNKPEES